MKWKEILLKKIEDMNSDFTENSILDYLKQNPISLKSSTFIIRNNKKLDKSIISTLEKLLKAGKIKRISCINKLGDKEYLYQMAESPVWKHTKISDSLKLSDYISLCDFTKNYLYKNSLTRSHLKTTVKNKKVHSITSITYNKKITELYRINELKEIFKDNVKISKIKINSKTECKCKKTLKTLFKFKLFGKEISLNIN